MFRDPGRGVYKRLVLSDERIIGAVLYGDTADGNWFFDQLKDGDRRLGDARHADLRARLRREAPPWTLWRPLQPCRMRRRSAAATASARARSPGRSPRRPDHARRGARPSPRPRRPAAPAPASSSRCWRSPSATASSRPAAQADLQMHRPHATTTCAASSSQGLKSMPAVMQELGWKTAGGCHVCRPALNYYLLCAWPGDYRDDAQSRFINERVHANIQKDGTYLGRAADVGRRDHARASCAPSPTPPRSTTCRWSRSPAASASTCSASGRRTCRRSGPTSTPPAWSPATPTPRGCAR